MGWCILLKKIRFWGNAHALKVDFPGSCAAHKMGRKSAYFQVHAHAHLAGSGGMRMSLTLIGYGKIVFFETIAV